MWRKVSIIVLLLGVSLGILFWPEAKVVQTETVVTSNDPLIKVYQESEAEFDKLQIEGWVLINNNFESLENLNKVIATLDAETDISLARLKRTTFGDEETVGEEIYTRGIHLEGNDRGYRIVVDAQTTRTMQEEGPEPETYIVITLENEALDLKYNANYEQIKKGLERLAPNSQASAVITAKAKLQLNQEQREAKLEEMLKVVEAKQLDIISTDNLTSVTGYTPLIKHSVKVSDQQMNINLAGRENFLEEVTYFYIGTPIISTEY